MAVGSGHFFSLPPSHFPLPAHPKTTPKWPKVTKSTALWRGRCEGECGSSGPLVHWCGIGKAEAKNSGTRAGAFSGPFIGQAQGLQACNLMSIACLVPTQPKLPGSFGFPFAFSDSPTVACLHFLDTGLSRHSLLVRSAAGKVSPLPAVATVFDAGQVRNTGLKDMSGVPFEAFPFRIFAG